MIPTKPTQYPQLEPVPALEVHPSVSPLAAELLMKTAERLALNPASYNQQWPRHSCNSPCCIIAHMEHIAHEDCIGLTPKQHSAIFYTCNWPVHLQPKENTFDAVEAITASAGIARIEHMLATGQ